MQIFFATKVRRESQPPQPFQKCYYILWFLWVYSPSSWHTLETNYWLKFFSVVNSHVLNTIENMYNPMWLIFISSTSIHVFVLIDVCHFHLLLLIVVQFQQFMATEMLVLISWILHPRILFNLEPNYLTEVVTLSVAERLVHLG